MSSPYLAKQLNGPYAQTTISGIQLEFGNTDIELDYMYDLSIATAVPAVLSQIGLLIGYPWPILPANLSTQNVSIITFISNSGSSYNPQYSTLHGLSSLSRVYAGQFASIILQVDNYLPITTYQQFLPLFAKLKKTGMTLSSIDAFAQLFGPHQISWVVPASGLSNAGDIQLTFSPVLSPYDIYIVQNFLSQLMVDPQIFVS